MEVPLYRWEEWGGAFFLIFILFTVLIGLPLLIAEFMIGRSTQKQALEHLKASHQIQDGIGLDALVLERVLYYFHFIVL